MESSVMESKSSVCRENAYFLFYKVKFVENETVGDP